MHTRTTTAAALLLIAGLATACTTTAQPQPAPTTTTAKPSPTPSETGPMALGAAYRWNDPQAAGTTTVLAYEQPVKVDIATTDGLGVKDGVWATVEVKVCVTRGDVTVSQFPWQLAMPDDSRFQTTGLFGGTMPKPEYPAADTPVRAGDCLRGKIPFLVPRAQRPVRVVYGPEGSVPVEWAVPAR